MESGAFAFSIWHGVLAVLAVIVPLVAVYLENSGLRSSRLSLFQWLMVLYLAVAAVFHLVELTIDTPTADLAALVAGIAATFPFFQRMVRRARDAGWGKTLPFLAAIPGVGVVVLVILLVVPTEK